MRRLDLALAVISLDAADSFDLEHLPIRGRHSLVRNVTGTFPTLTYPAHVTLMTGLYSHGILHNEREMSHDWNTDARAIRGETLLTLASAHGLSTASVSWPVTVHAPATYLFPEVWPPKMREEQERIYEETMTEGMRPFYERHRHLLKSFKGKDLDRFSTAMFCSVVSEVRPDLAFLHLADIDCNKHQGITDYSFTSQCLEKVYEACDGYDIVLLSDHSQKKARMKFSLRNALGNEHVVFQEGAFFSYVYSDGISDEKTYELLSALKEEYPECIAGILDADEVERRYHVKGGFSFVVEASDGIYFTPSGTAVFSDVDRESFSMASHGYLPEKGPHAFFLLDSERATGITLEKADMVDVAPTVAALAGLCLKCDGRVLEELYE